MASEVVNVVVAFAFIYLFFKWMSKGNDNAGRADSPAAILGFSPRKATDDMIATVHAAFPDIPRANIHYDLLKTGSAEVTSNKILERGVLDAPPAAYYRAFPIAQQQQQQPAAGPAAASASPAAPADLISRFQLEQRVAETPVAEPPSAAASWEASAEKREASLRERKAQMILDARRRMAEKLQASSSS